MPRILGTLIALVSAAVLALTVAPATADSATTERTTVARAATTLTINAKIINESRLKIWGKAPRWQRKPVLLQRKTVRGGTWKVVERDRTTRRGLYEFSSAPVPDNCKDFIFRTKVKSPRYNPSPITEQSYSRC